MVVSSPVCWPDRVQEVFVFGNWCYGPSRICWRHQAAATGDGKGWCKPHAGGGRWNGRTYSPLWFQEKVLGPFRSKLSINSESILMNSRHPSLEVMYISLKKMHFSTPPEVWRCWPRLHLRMTSSPCCWQSRSLEELIKSVHIWRRHVAFQISFKNLWTVQKRIK